MYQQSPFVMKVKILSANGLKVLNSKFFKMPIQVLSHLGHIIPIIWVQRSTTGSSSQPHNQKRETTAQVKQKLNV